MGRWAQRKRTGGGAPVLNYMVDAVKGTDFLSTAEYQNAVDATQLDDVTFVSTPSATPGLAVDQNGTHEIVITWDANTAGDTGITYTGVTPGIVTPQTILY